MSTAQRTLRVVAAIIEQGGRYLITQRRPNAVLPLLWEFPGGKVEAGESEPDAVVRECREELGVAVRCRIRVPGEWQIDELLVLRVYLGEIISGEPRPGADHDQVRWLSRAELFDVDWLPPDLPAAVALTSLLPT